jgi:dihydroorotate dehydrogenase
MPSRSLWQVLCLAGVVGFLAAIGVHPVVGYNDLIHLAPATLGAMLFTIGLVLTYRPMCSNAMPFVRPEQANNPNNRMP